MKRTSLPTPMNLYDVESELEHMLKNIGVAEANKLLWGLYKQYGAIINSYGEDYKRVIGQPMMRINAVRADVLSMNTQELSVFAVKLMKCLKTVERNMKIVNEEMNYARA